MPEAPKGLFDRFRDFFLLIRERRRQIIEAQESINRERMAAMEEIRRRRAALPPEQRGGLMQGFLERFRAMRDASKTQKAQLKSAFRPALKEEIDRKAVPNQKPVSLYSTEEILKGNASVIATAVKEQFKNAQAEARWKDAEEKLSMRPGIDGGKAVPQGPA